MIRHIVMFRLKEEISKDILPEVKARALSLRDKIPFIRGMEVHAGAAARRRATMISPLSAILTASKRLTLTATIRRMSRSAGISRPCVSCGLALILNTEKNRHKSV